MQDGTLAAAALEPTTQATTGTTTQATSEAEAKPLPAPAASKPNKPAKRPAPSKRRDAFKPTAKDRFTFPLSPIINGGCDALGHPSRPTLDPAAAIEVVAKASGVHGVTVTDDDLSPSGATDKELAKLRSSFKRTFTKHKMKVAAIACDLAREGVFRDGAFTSADQEVRAYAVQKAMKALDLGAEVGCKLMVFNLAREGNDIMGALDAQEARRLMQKAINFLCVYAKHKKYGYRFALRTQQAGIRRTRLWPTSAHHLVHIPSFEHEEMVGVSVSFAQERAAGVDPSVALAQALGEQRLCRVEFDMVDGASREMLEAVRVLEESNYDGFVHLDIGAMRSASADGAAARMTNAMRQYLMLRAKARQWKSDPKIRAAKRALNKTSQAYAPIERGFTVAGAKTLMMRSFDTTKVRDQRLPYDQLEARSGEIVLS